MENINNHFPYNIMQDSNRAECDCWKNEQEFMELYHADDGKLRGAFWFIVGGMQERTAKVLLNRYRDNMTYSAISKEVGLSVERCRQLVAKGLREFRKKRNLVFLVNGICETYETEMADDKRRNLEIGKNEVLVELLELLNNKAVTIETLRNIYIENRECANPFLDMTIDEFADEFKLSIRTYNCIIRAFRYTRTAKERTPEEIVKLRRRGISDDNAHWAIRTVRDLATLTDDEIRNIRNLGQKSYMELIHAMKLAGVEPKPAPASEEGETA